MSRSPIQRLIRELRRRHVPQTTAIYLVAAWALIEFSDVVVPNLNGPQWVVTTVIVAALVGFPIMLVFAWVFELGPDGIRRTEPELREGMTGAPTGAGPSPWFVVLLVLAVGVGSAMAVALVLRGGPGTEEAAAPAGTVGTGASTDSVGGQSLPRLTGPPSPGAEGMPVWGPGFADSLRLHIEQAYGVLDSMDLSGLAEIGREAAMQAGLGIMLSQPEPWVGVQPQPAPLAEGDTMMVQGMAFDTAGLTLVTVDGDTVASGDGSQQTLPFSTILIGRGSAGARMVSVIARTRDGRELRRELQIIQLPTGTP